jgi:hypothetical protein
MDVTLTHANMGPLSLFLALIKLRCPTRFNTLTAHSSLHVRLVWVFVPANIK